MRRNDAPWKAHCDVIACYMALVGLPQARHHIKGKPGTEPGVLGASLTLVLILALAYEPQTHEAES